VTGGRARKKVKDPGKKIIKKARNQNVIFRLKKQGKIKSTGRGVYVIAKE